MVLYFQVTDLTIILFLNVEKVALIESFMFLKLGLFSYEREADIFQKV